VVVFRPNTYCLAPCRQRGKPHLQEVCTALARSRDLAWTRPFDAVSRLSRETRRSYGAPDQ